MAWIGRTNQEPETFNFGGLNLKATQVNIRDGEAQDIENVDIDFSGALTTRSGYTNLTSVAGNVEFFGNYFTSSGEEIFVIIANHKFYESNDINGPFVDRTGIATLTGTNWNGAYCADSFIFSNGVEQPFISRYGWDIQSLETASIVPPPTGLSGIAVGGGTGTNWFYAVSSVTERGESIPCPLVVVNSNATLDSTFYNELQWVAADGAQAYNIYQYNGTVWAYLDQTTASSYADQGKTIDTSVNPKSASDSYNTPNDWNLNGSPEGFAVLSRGRNQHLIAWRKNNVWAAAYGSATDWFTQNDAFAFQIQGGEDNSVTAVVALYDFTVFFSSTNAFAYTGSSAADITQNKILHTGCVSPDSVVLVGDDIYLWSQFGPTTLSRILQGADIQLTPMSIKVAPLVYDQTNRTLWPGIAGWHDIRNQRVCWAFPGSGSSDNDGVLVFNYAVAQPDGSKGAWTRYSGWNIVNAITSYSTSNVWGALRGGTIAHLHNGNTDNGTEISWFYKSSWYDLRTWIKKRIMWLDLLVDSSLTYAFDAILSWEFNRAGWSQTHTVSNTTTDGYTIDTLGDLNEHRVFMNGNSRYFQFVFQGSGTAKIVAWRPEARIKGIR